MTTQKSYSIKSFAMISVSATSMLAQQLTLHGERQLTSVRATRKKHIIITTRFTNVLEPMVVGIIGLFDFLSLVPVPFVDLTFLESNQIR